MVTQTSVVSERYAIRETYTVGQLAATLQVSEGKVYQMIRERLLPTLDIGGRTLISGRIVDEILRGERSFPLSATKQRRRGYEPDDERSGQGTH